MAEPPLESNDGLGAQPDRMSPPGMPGWVKVFGIIIAIVVVVMVISALAGGGHSPGRHL